MADTLINYVLENKGKLQITPSSVSIDGVQITDNICNTVSAKCKGNPRFQDILQILNIGQLNIKCSLLKGCNCCKGAKSGYARIIVNQGAHTVANPCYYCAECLRKLGIYYLNLMGMQNYKPSMLWKCSCGRAIPCTQFMMVLGNIYADFIAQMHREGKFVICFKCGEITLFENLQEKEIKISSYICCKCKYDMLYDIKQSSLYGTINK